MTRKEFLGLIGVTAGVTVVASCMSSCKKKSTNLNIDFTLDLSLPAYAVLLNNGGYLVNQGAIVAKTIAGAYVAVAAACTHEGQEIMYQSSSDKFRCPRHGALFSDAGAVLQGPASTDLQKFNTTLNGTLLRVYS